MSRTEQWLSRIVFYTGAIATLWVMGKMTPTSADLEAKRDLELGASQVVIILPGGQS